MRKFAIKQQLTKGKETLSMGFINTARRHHIRVRFTKFILIKT